MLLTESLKNILEISDLQEKFLFEELKLKNISDLLEYFPKKYISRIKIDNVSEINDKLLDNVIDVTGIILNFCTIETKNKKKHLEGYIIDKNNNKLKLIWFKKIESIPKWFKEKNTYTIHGELKKYMNEYCIIHPHITKDKDIVTNNTLVAYYTTTEKLKKFGIDSRFFRRILNIILKNIQIEENIPEYIIDKYKLMPRYDAIKNIHQPTDNDNLFSARRRLKFEELFFLQLNIFQTKYKKTVDNIGYIFDKIDYVKKFKTILEKSFELTNAQKNVLKEIYSDLKSGKQMNRLLQGDVGSGKTIVAFITMLISVSNESQAILMCPTEILAEQHFMKLKQWCEDLEMNIALLTSSTKQKDKENILKKIKNGEINIVIGTQSLLNDNIIFNKLGIIIIDEQHKFGVYQRGKITENYTKYSDIQPHILIMTATPIPRTLAMTMYNDCEVSVINELPKNRKPIKTIHFYYSERLRVFNFIKKQIELGQQVYFVYPLIEESNKIELRNLNDGYQEISNFFKNVNISIVNGQMDFEKKNAEFEKFKNGESKILISTTVIEVGIDVPNATVIVIEEADHYGLSQLHQLRGRVGRGDKDSFCILMTRKQITNTSKQRIKAMLETNDGFKLSNIDLQLRGFGNIFGTEQSGKIKLKIADYFNDIKILKYAIIEAKEIINDDPNLEKNTFLKEKMLEKNSCNFGLIV